MVTEMLTVQIIVQKILVSIYFFAFIKLLDLKTKILLLKGLKLYNLTEIKCTDSSALHLII